MTSPAHSSSASTGLYIVLTCRLDCHRINPIYHGTYANKQQQSQTGAANTPGHALTVAEERKMAAHAEACHAVGVHFIPLAAETLGALSREAIDTVSSIGHIQGQRLGIPPAESIRHLFQRLAIALWRGNATLWILRQPVRPAVVDGLI